MKFSHAWADVSNQNTVLKLALFAMTFIAVILSGGLSVVSLKDPLIIEKGKSTCAVLGSEEYRSRKESIDELQSFFKEALSQRFDTSNTLENLISDQERHFRLEEQKKLKSNGITQAIVTANLKAHQLDESRVILNADRLLSVGDVRSAFKFPLKVQFKKVTRSIENPYGLIIDKIEPATSEEIKALDAIK